MQVLLNVFLYFNMNKLHKEQKNRKIENLSRTKVCFIYWQKLKKYFSFALVVTNV